MPTSINGYCARQSGALGQAGQAGQVALQVTALTASTPAHHIHAPMALVPCAQSDKRFRYLFTFLYWIYVIIFIFIVLPLYGTLFPTPGFSHRVYRRGFNEAIGTLCFPFSPFMAFGFACCYGAQQEGKCCNISLVLLCHV